jgi:hypothetical protein
MRLSYSKGDPSQNEFDGLPRLPLKLSLNNIGLDVAGLVDSAATVNVLPYQVGLRLGATWDDRQVHFHLTGNLANFPAIPLFVDATVGQYPTVELAFAWVKTDEAPLILGQTNFFMEFDVCFYRSQLEFEVNPKS